MDGITILARTADLYEAAKLLSDAGGSVESSVPSIPTGNAEQALNDLRTLRDELEKAGEKVVWETAHGERDFLERIDPDNF